MGSHPTPAMTGRLRREKRDIHEGARRTTNGHQARRICFNGANRRKVIHPGARASRPHPYSLWRPLSISATLQAATRSAGNRNGQAEEDPLRRCRSIQVAEMAGAAGGIVRAGRPRSRVAFIPPYHSPQEAEPAIRAGTSRPVYPVHPCASMFKKISIPCAVAG